MLIIIAISLSMDAFSLALAYGTLGLNKKDILILSAVVGIYHFFMPLIGMIIGNIILNYIKISPSIIVFIILTFIGFQMIFDKKENEIKKMNNLELLLFGLAVSIDSFSVGVGIKTITNNYILGSIFFSIFSFLFTFLGLKLGKRLNSLFGRISVIIGGIVLIIIGILYIL